MNLSCVGRLCTFWHWMQYSWWFIFTHVESRYAGSIMVIKHWCKTALRKSEHLWVISWPSKWCMIHESSVLDMLLVKKHKMIQTLSIVNVIHHAWLLIYSILVVLLLYAAKYILGRWYFNKVKRKISVTFHLCVSIECNSIYRWSDYVIKINE